MDKWTEFTCEDDGVLVLQFDEEKHQFYLGPNAFSTWITLRTGLWAGTTLITNAVVFDFFHNYAPFVDTNPAEIKRAWANFKRALAQGVDQPRTAFFEFMDGNKIVVTGYGLCYRPGRQAQPNKPISK